MLGPGSPEGRMAGGQGAPAPSIALGVPRVFVGVVFAVVVAQAVQHAGKVLRLAGAQVAASHGNGRRDMALFSPVRHGPVVRAVDTACLLGPHVLRASLGLKGCGQVRGLAL